MNFEKGEIHIKSAEVFIFIIIKFILYTRRIYVNNILARVYNKSKNSRKVYIFVYALKTFLNFKLL